MYYISLDTTVKKWEIWIYIGQEMSLEHFFIERKKESFIYIYAYCFSIDTKNQPSLTQLLKPTQSVTSELY